MSTYNDAATKLTRFVVLCIKAVALMGDNVLHRKYDEKWDDAWLDFPLVHQEVNP